MDTNYRPGQSMIIVVTDHSVGMWQYRETMRSITIMDGKLAACGMLPKKRTQGMRMIP